MHRQMIMGTDDDELPATFQQVKTPPVHLCDQGGTPHFALDIAHCAADNPA